MKLQIMCLYFSSALFPFQIKQKLQKRERTCRAYMKVLEQSALFVCCPPPPLYLCNCVCPSPSSAACTVCTVMYSLFSAHPFFFFLIIALHTDTARLKLLFTSNYSGAFVTWMCLCTPAPPHALAVVYLILSGVPYCVFPSISSRLLAWMPEYHSGFMLKDWLLCYSFCCKNEKFLQY